MSGQFDDRVAQLTPSQREWLRNRLGHESPGQTILDIPPRQTNGPAPLSHAQEWMFRFIHERGLEGVSSFTLCQALRVSGPLDVPSLKSAIGLVVTRQSALRTCFFEGDQGPVQGVLLADEVPLRTVDLSGESRDRGWAAVVDLARGETETPFELVRGPLFRPVLARMSSRDHILLWTVHHLIFDEWSGGVLLRELMSAYDATVAGEALTLPLLEIQYADYAAWQRERLQGPALDRSVAYWSQQLIPAPRPLRFAGASSTAMSSLEGGVRSILLSEQAEGLRLLGQQNATPLFGVLLAGLYTTLYISTGNEDLLVTAFIADRAEPALAPLIGFFVNTLPFRIRLDPTMSFRALVLRVRELMAAGYAHGELHVAEVEKLLPERVPFQVSLNFTAADGTTAIPASRTGLVLTPLNLPQRVLGRRELSLFLREEGTDVHVTALHNLALMPAATVSEFLNRFRGVLAAAAADASRDLIDLGTPVPAG